MSGTRRHYTDEFKAEAVALLASSGRPLEHIARELGIQPSLLRHWRKRGSSPGGMTTPPSAQAASPQGVAELAAEVARLRKENDRLRMERDILKKTVSIFSEAPR